MRGAGYIKDNRLLPTGFDKETATLDVSAYGAALEDPDFLGGGDRVEIIIDLGDADGPFTLNVELLYQSLSYRWVENLRPVAAKEIDQFMKYYDAIPNEPIQIESLTMEIGE
jgi:hypothetical protein